MSLSALPALVLLTLPAMEIARSSRDDARFYFGKRGYEAEASAARAAGKHIAWVDDWSPFFNANSFVVWDDQDDPEKASGFKLQRRLGDHFYLVGD